MSSKKKTEAGKANGTKDMTFDEACAAIDREMATLVRLAEKNGAKDVRRKWEDLKRSLRASAKPQAVKPAAPKPAAKPAQKAPVAKVTKEEAAKAQPQEKSVKVSPNEIVLNLNGFMTQSGAAHDASELLTYPNVFRYRATMFPDPRRYGVQPTIAEAKAVERKHAKFTSKPWTVRTRITVLGPAPKAAAWCQAVLAKNKNEQE